jgi:hypothetical protein
MLKYSKVNRRVISVEQAQWGAFIEDDYLNFINNSDLPYEEAVKVWGWVLQPRDELEMYQGTMDDKQDNRNEFLEAKEYEASAKKGLGKNILSIENASADSTGEGN